MIKTTRSRKEIEANLYRLKGGSDLPIKSPYKTEIEREKNDVLAELKTKIAEFEEKIKEIPKIEDIIGHLKIGGKHQLELRDIKGARLDVSNSFTKEGVRYMIEEMMHGAGSGSGGGTILEATGTVNGVNTSFTFTTAPVMLVVDGVPKQKTSSDGTANWTGTTTVTLLIAPTFDIFGY